MSAYVSDWAQEVYGDFRNYAVPESALSTRRDSLNDYLQHKAVLAGVGPSTTETARSYLQSAYTPFANAAWQWSFGFGWTAISADQMKQFVSAQTYALRYFSQTGGQAQDHWGFAWAPRNGTGSTPPDFTKQTSELLDRLGAAIHDSAQPLDPSNPGIGACGPPGQGLGWCGAAQLVGASFNDAWKTFRVWALPPRISFFTPRGGPIGTTVTISGAHFTGATAVAFNGTPAVFTVVSETEISATVPSGASSGPITVTTPAGSATSSTAFTVTVPGPSPTISSFTPSSGPVGTTVTISGEHITGATAVAFNGTPASFTIVSDTQIRATVPSGASSGPITVTTPAGSATSSTAFTVTVPGPSPTISSFTPSSGPVGTTVTISGSHFTGATAVAFNGTAASFTVTSDTQIRTTVPSGASSGPIGVTTSAGSATSLQRFSVGSGAGTG
jgi:hypothetical protein